MHNSSFFPNKGEIKHGKEDFFISTSLTHLGALRAHGYWDEVSGVENALPHSQTHF